MEEEEKKNKMPVIQVVTSLSLAQLSAGIGFKRKHSCSATNCPLRMFLIISVEFE